eukprot:CAMPEP_0202480462 /NCGR_PEP_ID=MMETSP1361-20130828/443_1 /ASSEMBLY_ACC=CAM_ASM_000849 /TAXON_ID=210615 /ORGANISM="Staurosira complex sp., Strain CCMP2646" /LENGTH=221 /DNA_ID=CAMNT_0049107899 /DNA_START=16 /DNA_END=681 /DNA_ORIENTATION=-
MIMMHRRFRAIAVLALSSLMVISTSAFSANQMETRRIQRQHQLEAHRHYHPSSFDADVLVKTVAGIMTAGLLIFSSPLPSLADGSRVVGELRGSGLVFKDTLEIESFEDPKVKGITLYISNFQRPLTERLSKDFFSDPSDASVTCVKTGTIQIADNIATVKNGEEVFEESRSLLFKSLRVQRIYDREKNTIVYVSFNTRLDKNADTNKSRFKSSLCAINLS